MVAMISVLVGATVILIIVAIFVYRRSKNTPLGYVKVFKYKAQLLGLDSSKSYRVVDGSHPNDYSNENIIRIVTDDGKYYWLLPNEYMWL